MLYDGNCKLCRRTISVLLAGDWLRSLKAVNAIDRPKFAALGLSHLQDADLATDIHAASRDGRGEWSVGRGYHAYQKMAWRIPALWITLPLIYLPPVVAVGKRIYRSIADSRTCQIASAPLPSQRFRPQASIGLVLAIGALILAPQLVLGLGRLRKSWPVACYPLFDTLATRTVRWPEFETTDPQGRTIALDDDPIREHYTSSRYVSRHAAICRKRRQRRIVGAVVGGSTFACGDPRSLWTLSQRKSESLSRPTN